MSEGCEPCYSGDEADGFVVQREHTAPTEQDVNVNTSINSTYKKEKGKKGKKGKNVAAGGTSSSNPRHDDHDDYDDDDDDDYVVVE